MAVTKVKTKWTSGNLDFLTAAGLVIFTVDSDNRKVNVPTGSTLTVVDGIDITWGLVGEMAAAGTSTANTVGVLAKGARVDHVHALGTHIHGGATTGGQIGPPAFANNIFTANAAGRAPFADGIWTGAKLAVGVLSADATGRALFAAGVLDVTTFQSAVAAGILSANATGRAFMATDYFNAAHVATAFATNSFDATNCADIIADNAIPGAKVNWSYGVTPSTITPDDGAAAGTSGNVARIDHVHANTCAAPSAGLAASDAEGAAATFARSNHVHKATVTDAVDITFGASDDCGIRWDTTDADNHALSFWLGASLALHIAAAADKARDWNVAAYTNPTLVVHSATTPATDYIKISHDATTATIEVASGTLDLTAVGSVTVNEASADVDFRVESNDLQYAIYVDGAKNALVLGANGDLSNTEKLVQINRAAHTIASASRYADLWIVEGATVTTAGDGSTDPVIASVYLEEPNITKAGADVITVAATLYILDAPTEGSTNAALYVAAGDANFATITSRGTVTVADQQISLSTGNITFSGAGYIAMGVNPADAGYIRLPNNTYIYWRNAANNANVGIALDANNNLEIANITLGGGILYGGNGANVDLDLRGTYSGTVTTSYIIPAQMIDATAIGLATKVIAGAVGDGNFTQTALNGLIALDSTNGRIYFRYGAAWHYAAQTAGFSIPEFERLCPICAQEILVGDAVVGVIDELQSDGARHGVYCHQGCPQGAKGISLPHKVVMAKVERAGFPNAAERAKMGVEKKGSDLIPIQ